jgi:LPS O-antigen subunit length determinant protein (WzzB/FepE family)
MTESDRALDQEQGFELMAYLDILLKRKWLILLPTLVCMLAAAVYSLFLPKIWEITAILEPGRFSVQTETGEFKEVIVSDPKQIAGQINQEAYTHIIAAELNSDVWNIPKVRAENLKDTKLVKMTIRNKDIPTSLAVLNQVFSLIKADLDRKVDVEIKSLESGILSNENIINEINLDIQTRGYEKDNLKEEIVILKNKMAISELRVKNLIEEMGAVKKRIEAIDEQEKRALIEKREGTDAISLLLYSNEIQQNLRYYNALETNLSGEKVNQEELKKTIGEKTNEIKKTDTLIEIDKTKIEEIKNKNAFLNQKRGRIDYTLLKKEPQPSNYPVAPRKAVITVLAGFMSFIFFTFLAVFSEFFSRYKKQRG